MTGSLNRLPFFVILVFNPIHWGIITLKQKLIFQHENNCARDAVLGILQLDVHRSYSLEILVKRMQSYSIFCDESATCKKHSNMVFGAIGGKTSDIIPIMQAVSDWKLQKPELPSEFRWTDTAPHKLQHTKLFCDGIFNRLRSGEIIFRSMVMNHRKMDYRKFYDGDKELGFYRFMYHFLLHSFKGDILPESRVQVMLDERNSYYSLSDLKDALNRGVVGLFRRQMYEFVSVEPVSSASNHMIQMADILTGAVSHNNNPGRVNLESKRGKAKQELFEHIRQKSGLPDYLNNSPIKKNDFSIWHFKLQ